jgi:hypothetical protein
MGGFETRPLQLHHERPSAAEPQPKMDITTKQTKSTKKENVFFEIHTSS